MTVEVAHIVPWSKVRKREFANLISLCPNCHTAYDGGRIDHLSMRQYKANLALLNGRYEEYERRVLDYFTLNPAERIVYISGGMELLVMYLGAGRHP